MNNKKCVFCGSDKVVKKGSQNGIQRWLCKTCNKKFQANRKALPSLEELFYSFCFHKQTLKELRHTYEIRISTIQQQIDAYVLQTKIHNPKSVHIVVDACYFGGREDENGFCVIVFRDPKLKENLWYQFTKTENRTSYIEGRIYLESLGYDIKSVTSDGLGLIREAFTGIPFQMCLTHMRRIIERGTTLKPVLEASKVLLALAKTLHKIEQDSFFKYMRKFKDKYINFVNEKTIDPNTGIGRPTHEGLHKAYYSTLRLSQYLFTYKHSKDIHNTSNSLEGFFKNLRVKLAVHHGLSIKRKQKLIAAMILNNSTVLKEEK
jgi:hypothetical protein